MPSVEDPSHGIPAVAAFEGLLSDLLRRAEAVKPVSTIEPPLKKSDFDDLQSRLSQVVSTTESAKGEEGAGDSNKTRRFAIIETAARNTLSHLIATTSIDSPEFVQVWNFFDILSIVSDAGQCEPALLFWLVEELLDSQTIAGCRKVFDFLESRRETITGKNFDQKKLATLRTCNELLRRLSRAEDTAFCGRVFIFLYQSFPLGDRSSVNLRGEFHVENVTTFDDPPPKGGEDEADKMDVDSQPNGADKTSDQKAPSKAVSFEEKKQQQQQQGDKALEPDTLYPIFWSLQSSFNQPKKLFDAAHFTDFKAGLEATMTTFRSIKPDQGSRPVKQEKQPDDAKRNLKRKRDDGEGLANGDNLGSGFNPKYLTSRDLFELEISDLSFRRHILVQALIIIDFLLSLSAKAKEKLSTAKALNKSVTYSDQLLSEEDTKWASGMKKTIADYLRQGAEGPYFFRMVETVLSRDKNWVRWKIENCPSIEKAPVSPDEFSRAKAAASKATTNKRLRPTPMGSLPLGFLSDDGDRDGAAMGKLTSADRYRLPELSSFRRKIADDDFEIEMPTNNKTKAAAVAGKASKSWRALRIAGRYKLAAFDKIDNPDKIDVVFEEDAPREEEPAEESRNGSQDGQSAAEAKAPLPEDRRAVVFAGSPGSARTSLVRTLLERKTSAFGKVARHVTRKPDAAETKTNGQRQEQQEQDVQLVDAQTFSMMRDGDQLLEFTDVAEGPNSGTSRKAVDAISESGKVPILELDRQAADQVRDIGYPARFVFVGPAGEAAGVSKAPASQDVYDAVVADGGDDLEGVYKGVEAFLYGSSGRANGDATRQAAEGDVGMEDVPGDGNHQAEPVTNGIEAA